MSRIEKIRRTLRTAGADAALITNYTNVSYLTGFTGDDSYLFISKTQAIVISDPRYTTQLEQECAGLELDIRAPGVPITRAVAQVIQKSKSRRVLVEAGSLTLALFEKLRTELPGVELIGQAAMVEELRMIKDAAEVEAIRGAIYCAERAYGVIQAAWHPEQTERQVAHELERQIRLFGGDGCCFPPIVAVGPRAALPHARATDVPLGDSDFVLIDWGSRKGGYVSDLTRVMVTGKIPPKLQRIYDIVLQAQLTAIEQIRPGVKLADVDQAARGVIEQAGFGKQFGHGLGHGIGLEVHEGPRLAKQQEEPLKAGMVVTVEPGIYLPGWGGVRIEDDVLVTRGGHEVLTSVNKQLG